jgi:hypothetical protein
MLILALVAKIRSVTIIYAILVNDSELINTQLSMEVEPQQGD